MPRPTGTQTRHFAYNNTAFLQSATNPENGTVTYTYDSLNRLSTVVDAKNQQKVFTYDSYNRVTQVQRYVKSGGAFVEDPMQRTNFYYDSNPFGTSTYVAGRLAAVQYYGGHCSSYVPSGTQSGCDLIQEWYGYNQAGARLSKTVKITRGSQVGSMTVSWTYDNEGRPLKVTYPGGGSCTTCTPSTGSSYTNAYDTMGRPNTLTDTVNTRTLVSGITYGVANEVQQLTSGYTTGVNSESNTYNSMFQLTQLQVGSSALNIQYNYSATQNNGKISSQTDALSGEQIAYTYDALNRLASAQTTQTGGTQWGQSYTYDGFGNLTDQTVIKGGAPDVHVAYNYLTNQQTGDTADANGNIGAGYIYDLENRLVQPGSSSPVHYGYDAGNKRIWRGDSTSGLDEFALWGAGQKLATYQITANAGLVNFALTSTRVYFGHKLISTGTYNSSGTGDKVTLTPVVADRQGSIKKFYPFGTERPSATTNDTEKFTGYFRDAATGLDYADQRYEQPGTGRFITPDPSSGGATTSDPGSWHKYAYTRGDPVNRIDPQGLADFSVTGTGHFYPEYFPWDPYYIFVQGSYQLNYSSDQGGDGGLDGVDALRWIWGIASARAALDAFVNMKFSEKCADSIQNALGGQAGFQGLTKSGSDFGALAAVQLIASGAKIADGSNTTDPVGVTAFPLDPDLAAKIQSTADVQSGIPNTPMSIVFLLNPRLMAMGQFDGDTIFVNPSAFLQSGSGMNLYTMFHESLHLAGFYDAQLEGLLGIPDSVVKSLGSTSITFKLMELCNQ
jgi:RHS repeat-associated protein